ncbi:MAG: hypothetical protein PUE32_09660 [Clostridia bacterium]|nr:hypothetical protein [Clostridia bacterium]
MEKDMGLIGKIKNKIKDIYSSDDISEKEYERYLENYHNKDDNGMNPESSFWKEWSLKEDSQDADEEYLEWKKQHQTLENVNLSYFSEPDMIEYIRGQCEVMEDATHHIDEVMVEYNNITEHFKDIELFENAPEVLKQQIAYLAEKVDNLTVDRRIVKSGEAKLSNNAYHRMETYEEEIPKMIEYIASEEEYYDALKNDLRMLEGEQMSLRMEARSLKKRQINIRQSCIIMLACFAIVYCVFLVATIASENQMNILVFFIVTVIGAAMALGSFALMRYTRREVAVTEIKLNKATNLLNKTKIKFVNTSNVLDYEYTKFRVNDADELSRKYQCYIEMKAEQQEILRMTASLNEAENDLLGKLNKLGMNDSLVWLSQAKALYNHNEMVEIRHDLSVGRQKIREQIEYNEKRIQSSKNNIKRIMEKYPQYMKATMEILDEFERRNSKK